MVVTQPSPAWTLVYRLLFLTAERCPDCRRQVREHLSGARLDTVVASFLSASDVAADLTAPAPALVDRLLSHAHPHELLRTCPPRDPAALARELLERSRLLLASDPGSAEKAASLARTALEASPDDASALRLAAAIHHANAVRTSDPEEAGRILDAHLGGIASCVSLRLRGDLYLIAGLIRRDQELLDHASLLFRRALDTYELTPDDSRLTHALLHAASCLRELGRLDEAIATSIQATEHADPDSDRHAYLAAHHNLAAYLVDDQQLEAARETLLRIVPFYPAAPDSPALLHYRWLCARLASATGDLRGALGTYEDLQARLLAMDRHRDAALVALERARFYLDLHEPEPCRAILLDLRTRLSGQLLSPASVPVRGLLADLAAGRPPTRRLLDRLAVLLRRA